MPTPRHLRNSATIFLGFVLLAAAQAQTAPAATVLHCANLIDAVSGKLLGATTVVIEGDRIKEVVPGSESRPGATAVELPGETCMPGLIDMHVHISMEFTPTYYHDQFTLNPSDIAIRSTLYAKRTLLAGFTTIRNLHDNGYETVALRNQINQGYVEGPRIFTAGPAISTTGGHVDPTNGLRHDLMGDPGPAQSIINGPTDAWKAVRQHYKEGADVIKIMTSGGVLDLGSSADNPQMTQEEINAIVAAAKDYGFTVAVHAHGAEGIRRAVIGGVDSIEHGTFMDDQDMQLMKQHGTWLVPTLYTGQYAAQMAKVPGMYPPQVAAKALAVGPHLIKTVAAAYKAGVKMAYGTDEGVYPHGQNWRDFPLLIQAGVPPMYAIQMATVNAAQLLKRTDDLGSIAPGKYADVVAVAGNPLDDINLMSKINFVMKGGTIYKQDGKELVVTSNAK